MGVNLKLYYLTINFGRDAVENHSMTSPVPTPDFRARQFTAPGRHQPSHRWSDIGELPLLSVRTRN